MRKLVIAVIVIALGWAGYWFVGAGAAEKTLQRYVAEAPEVEAAGIETRGFPNRFDTTITEPRLALAGGGQWSMPFFQVLSLSYRPDHLILVPADSQTLTLPGQKIEIASDGLRGSAVVSPSAPLRSRVTFVGERLAAHSDAGWSLVGAAPRLALRPTAAAENRLDLGASATDLAVTLPGRDAPLEDGRLLLDAELELAPGADLGRPDALRAISLRRARLDLGAQSLELSGEIGIDAQGRPDGSLQAEIAGLPGWLDLMVDAGMLAAEDRDRAGGVLQFLGGTTLTLPLVFREGLAFLGPLPLGPAPRLAL